LKLFITFIALIVFNCAYGDEILLNDGRNLTGKIISQDDKEVTFSLGSKGNVSVRFQKSDIKDIIIKPLPLEKAKKETETVNKSQETGSSPKTKKSEVKSVPAEPKIVDDPSFILYIPPGADFQERYPLVIALSPGADAQAMVNIWKPVSDKHKWVILASINFKMEYLRNLY